MNVTVQITTKYGIFKSLPGELEDGVTKEGIIDSMEEAIVNSNVMHLTVFSNYGEAVVIIPGDIVRDSVVRIEFQEDNNDQE